VIVRVLGYFGLVGVFATGIQVGVGDGLHGAFSDTSTRAVTLPGKTHTERDRDGPGEDGHDAAANSRPPNRRPPGLRQAAGAARPSRDADGHVARQDKGGG